MNSPTMTTPGLHPPLEATSMPPVYFRTADQLRLEGCVAGLLRDGRSVALSSLREPALDHYSRLLLARLRESSPLSALEVYFPADTAAMLSRFNEVLASQSVQQAMQMPGPDVVPRIWIVHDAGALADHEAQLLARLVQNFPGANVRVVLLLGNSTHSRKVFASFDRRMLRWDIEAPSSEQSVAMLVKAREDGCEGAVRELLQKLEIEPVLSNDPSRIDPLGFSAEPDGASLAGEGADDSGRSPRKIAQAAKVARKQQALRARETEKDERLALERRAAQAKAAAKVNARAAAAQRKSGQSSVWRWILVVGALASLSVAITAWLHPTVFSLDRWELTKKMAQEMALRAVDDLKPAARPADASAPVASAPAVPAAAETFAVPSAADLPSLAAAGAADSAAPGTAASPAVAASTPASAGPTASGAVNQANLAMPAPVGPALSKEPIKAVAVNPAMTLPVASPPVPAQVVPPRLTLQVASAELSAEAQAGQAWLKPIQGATFMLQHAALPTYEAAIEWRQQTAVLASSRVVPLYRPNDTVAYFAVVSGPYKSRAAAIQSAASNNIPPNAWLRTAKSLQEQFNPEPAPAGKTEDNKR